MSYCKVRFLRLAGKDRINPHTFMSLPVEIFLALRYLRPRRTFVSAITMLSVLGVTLGVMVLIVVLSVMEGFEQRLADKIIGFNAHLTVSNQDIVENAPQIIEELKRDPQVLDATPFAYGPVLAQFEGKITTPIIKGVPIEGDDAALPIRKFIVDGSYELRGDSILAGQQWARRSDAHIGDKVLIYAPRHFENVKTMQKGHGSVMLPDEFTITGIFSTGMFDYDLNFLVTSLGNAQRLYKLGNGVHGIAIRMKDPMLAPELKKKLNLAWEHSDIIPPLTAKTWMDQNRPLFMAIATERTVMSFILFFIMIVAAFGLCSTLITITVQKAREIGVLKAMGAREGQVAVIFALHGLIVGAIGAVGGVLLAVIVLFYRNPFRIFLSRRLGIEVFSPDVYNFTDIPAVTHPQTVLVIAAAAVVICVVAALIPARGAARLDPAQALRYE
jgi:lipoprotein-releasing system permease protein